MRCWSRNPWPWRAGTRSTSGCAWCGRASPPRNARFLADDEGKSVLEIYAGTPPLPPYASMDPLVLHVAFAPDDVGATRARLIAAGATAVGEVVVTPGGDQFAMLRDPWGLALQLARRARPLVGAREAVPESEDE